MKNLYAKQVKKINKKVAPSKAHRQLAARINSNRPLSGRRLAVKAVVMQKKNKKKIFLHKGSRKFIRKQKFRPVSKKYLKPSLDRNINFYKIVENVYGSYWLGKFVNTLQKMGKKKKAYRSVYNTMLLLRYSTDTNPLLTFLETLDRIKPTFKLQNYITRRVEIKQYPIAVLPSRRLIIAVHWLKEQARVQEINAAKREPLSKHIASILKQFKHTDYTNTLIKKRTEYMERSIKGQFNIRYTFRRK